MIVLPVKNLALALRGRADERLDDLLLQPGDEVGVGLVGDDGQLVDVVHRDGVVHPLAMLVDGQAQAAADLLTPGDGVVALLEHAHDEHVRVVPTLAQRRVGEDEPHRLLERKQPLLVLEDQVVGVDVGRTGPLPRPGLETARIDLPLGLLVDREVALVHGLATAIASQVLVVGRSVAASRSSSPRISLNDRYVLLLEDARVVAEGVLAVVVAVLGDLVDEEQRQDLDALREKLALLVEVRADDFADLDAPLRFPRSRHGRRADRR